MKSDIFQLKITLNYIRPPIWRRFLVDSNISLHELHQIVQDVMGWTNSHLYSFTIKQEEYLIPDPEGDIFEDSLYSNSSEKFKLKDLGLKIKDKFYYIYDFGDNWEHTITVEKISEGNEDIKVPICLDGKRACPPDDCGSVPGYEEILEALKNRKKKKYAELLEWLGDDYNPEQFDIEEMNRILQPRKMKRG